MKRALLISLVALLCLGGLLFLDFYEPFAYLRVRNLYQDALARAGRKAPRDPNLVFLAIDSDSTSLEEGQDLEDLYGIKGSNLPEARALRLMGQRWPWPREIYGLVLERLVDAGAKVVVFDLTFPSSTDGDAPFRLALERYRDRVVIGSNFLSAPSRESSTTGTIYTRPADTLIPQTEGSDDRVAFANFWPDNDEVIRRARYSTSFEEVDGKMRRPGSDRFLSLSAAALLKAGFAGAVPSDSSGRLLRFAAPPHEGFAPRSIFEIFVPDYWKQNYESGEFFRGKIVVIGAEGNWQHDEHPTPLGVMPGPEIHLNAMNAALHGAFIRELSPVAGLALTMLAGLLAISLSLYVRSPWLRIITLAAIDGLGLWLALIAFNRASLLVPLLAPFTELNFTVLFGLVSDLTWERIEKNRVRRTLEKYVSKNVVRQLLDQPKLYAQSLGGVLKPATILFSDIRGYSFVTARSDPQALVAQLNEYLTAMVGCVFRFGGTLDKFIGDAVMAVWGNTRSEGVRADAVNAVRAALAMREELTRLNESWATRGLPPLRIGVALNHGEVVVGNIGSPQRMEFTVIGEAVNVSWKLQELTKGLDADLIVGESVMALVIEEFDLRPLGEATIDSLPHPVTIFEVRGTLDPNNATLSAANRL
ncbi:MAG TPA: adenylate/guanylate cyclase domain-containing protein [Chthoniobacterales bacterium]|nr:adenylate/guanylate cyclase domain-containing protein [Chthoniobacterales bacterium]